MGENCTTTAREKDLLIENERPFIRIDKLCALVIGGKERKGGG